MKKYETVIIFDPTLDEDRISTKVAEVERRVRDGGGEVLKTNPWGKRKLAYPMGKKENGTYVLVEYSAPAPVVGEVDRVLRLDDSVLRHLTVVGPEEALVQAAAQAAEKAAQRRMRHREEEE